MSPRTRLFIALASTCLTAYIALGVLLGRVMGDTTYGQLSVFNEVVRLVIEAYVEPINVDRTMAGADLGLTDALDGDGGYLPPEELKAYQAKAGGDGEIGVQLTRRFAFLMVVSLRPGSPAEKAGLQTGDLLKTIDGRHSRPLPAPVGERLLRGAPGSIVKLDVLRAGSDPLEFSVVRERLTAAEPQRRQLADGAGYLRVREFYPQTAGSLRSEIDALRRSGASRLVLDLRGAGYGEPADAVKVAELFLEGGTVTKLEGRRIEARSFEADAATSAWDGPLAVLVDTGTAGPGEIVAAALRDAGRPLVGERTFGRAGVQRVVSMPEGGLLLTVGKYVSPKGEEIHGKGVQPTETVDAAIPASPDQKDTALEKALELLARPAEKKAA